MREGAFGAPAHPPSKAEWVALPACTRGVKRLSSETAAPFEHGGRAACGPE